PERPPTRSPSSAWVPAVGLSRQPRIAISVDLPEPDGPISATNSPRSTVRSIPRNAWTAAPLEPKTFVRPWVLMMGFILGLRYLPSTRGGHEPRPYACPYGRPLRPPRRPR